MKIVTAFLSGLLVAFLASQAWAQSNSTTQPADQPDPKETFNKIYGEELKTLQQEKYGSFVTKLISDVDAHVKDIPYVLYVLDRAYEYFIWIKTPEKEKNTGLELALRQLLFGIRLTNSQMFEQGKERYKKADAIYSRIEKDSSTRQTLVKIYLKEADMLAELALKPGDQNVAKKLAIFYLSEFGRLAIAKKYVQASGDNELIRLLGIISKNVEISDDPARNGITKLEARFAADWFRNQLPQTINKGLCGSNALKYYSLLLQEASKDKNSPEYQAIGKIHSDVSKYNSSNLMDIVQGRMYELIVFGGN